MTIQLHIACHVMMHVTHLEKVDLMHPYVNIKQILIVFARNSRRCAALVNLTENNFDCHH
jgi:hypothetical protein